MRNDAKNDKINIIIGLVLGSILAYYFFMPKITATILFAIYFAIAITHTLMDNNYNLIIRWRCFKESFKSKVGKIKSKFK